MERITTESQQIYYRFSGWEGVTHGIFTRHGGVSQGAYDSLNTGGTVGDDVAAVRRNHEIMYEALRVEAARTVTVWMVHGVDVVQAHAPVYNRRWLAQADGIMTDQPDLTLVMRYADCVPLLAYDPVRGVIGIGHAGWQGTVHGMAFNLIRAMQQGYGSQPQELRVGIGPCIGPDRYQVGEEVVQAVHQHFGTLNGAGAGSTPLLKRDPQDGTAYFNLWEANRRDLLRAGVADEQIEIAGICTATYTQDWYSHRAEKGKTGRFGVVLRLG